MHARRPPDTPGWQFPVAYTLKWVAAGLAVAALLGLVAALWLPDSVLPISGVLGVGLVALAKHIYETRSPGADGKTDERATPSTSDKRLT